VLNFSHRDAQGRPVSEMLSPCSGPNSLRTRVMDLDATLWTVQSSHQKEFDESLNEHGWRSVTLSSISSRAPCSSQGKP